jgi:Lon protease-like protein
LSDIPLFPLNVVLMPGAPLPLHIFEERYKQMVNECLEQEGEFGMVFADESGTRQVGCTAKIVELVERYEDGRMVILVEGSRRFRLNNVLTGKPYYVGEIEYFQDERRFRRDRDRATLQEPIVRHCRPGGVRARGPPADPGAHLGAGTPAEGKGASGRGRRETGA